MTTTRWQKPGRNRSPHRSSCILAPKSMFVFARSWNLGNISKTAELWEENGVACCADHGYYFVRLKYELKLLKGTRQGNLTIFFKFQLTSNKSQYHFPKEPAPFSRAELFEARLAPTQINYHDNSWIWFTVNPGLVLIGLRTMRPSKLNPFTKNAILLTVVVVYILQVNNIPLFLLSRNLLHVLYSTTEWISEE